MKKNEPAKTYKVKLLRGCVGEDGKDHKKGETLTCKRNLAKILVAAGRGEVVEGKSD